MAVGIRVIFGAPPSANPARDTNGLADARVVSESRWYKAGGEGCGCSGIVVGCR
jgi:hypothetical protein